MSRVLLVAACAGALYVALWPAVPNGDGLGYLKAQAAGALYPGHLGYVPLLGAVRRLFGVGARPVEMLAAARVVSLVAGLIAVVALGAAARRLVGTRHAAALAAAGLAASFGLLQASSDVETYAPATAAMCLALYLVARRRTGGGGAWTVAAALACAAAVLMHVENVLFVLPMALALPRRDGVALVAGAGVLVLSAYAAAGLGPRDLGAAGHGFHYPVSWETPAVAVYGACKALVFAPYPYEASWARVLGCFALGALPLGALAWLSRPLRLPLGGAATAAWLVPYAAVGVVFFASDAERWVFLLPLLWLTVAASARRPAAVAGVCAFLVGANLVVWTPRVRDDSLRRRAEAAQAGLADGDLVVSPGHGWDEYVGFFSGPRVEIYPLAYWAGALGSAEAVRADLARRARGRRVVPLRLSGDDDPLGWKELRPFGITPEVARALLPER